MVTTQIEKIDGDGFENYSDPSQSWRGKEPDSFKEICLRAIETCRIEWSKDMREGGTYNVQTSKGVMPVYFPDQRDVVMNATDTLHDLFFFYFDEEIKKNIKDIKEKISNVPNYNAKKFEELIERYKNKNREKCIKVADQMSMSLTLRLYRRMFRELLLLFKRKNELSTKRKINY